MSFSRRNRQRAALFILLVCIHTSKQGHGYATGGTQKPQGGSSGSITHIETLMPEYQTDHAEMYLCTSVLLPDEPLKLVGVEPLSKQEVVHHMLLFGECRNPTYIHPPKLPVRIQCDLLYRIKAEACFDTAVPC